MNVSCPDCRSVFRIDPAKVPDPGIRARCAVCGAVFEVARTPAAPPAITHAEALTETPAAVTYAPPEYALSEPNDGPITTAAAQSEQAASASMPSADARPAFAESVNAGHSTLPSRQDPEAARERVASPPPAPERTAVPAANAATAPTPAEPRSRPINPYLNNTPELRARRLARALVSDLVAYNPQKREQGLRDGTLRQLFRDEIRKSWDEYVEQVGAAVAESTPHFQDALNDVLAGGRRVF